MTWNPPPNVRAAGEALRGAIPNVQGTPLTSDNVREVQRPVQPGTRALRDFIRQRWGVPVGDVRGASVRKPLRRADGSLRNRDVHEEGRGLDVMSEGDLAKGAEVANWLVLNAQRLGIQYVIFDGLEVSSSRIGEAWETYTGTNPHRDHVHVELSPAWAADGHAMRARLGLPARADANAIHATGSSSARSSTQDGATVAGTAVERVRVFTGPRPSEAWLRSRFEVLFRSLRDVGLPANNALHTARAVLALWVTETGWNDRADAGESNFNGGNITGAGPYGFFRIPGNPRTFRAYADETDAARDALGVLGTGRYRAAWDRLILGGDPVEWYAQILRAGYTEFAQGLVDTYAGVLRLLPRKSGA